MIKEIKNKWDKTKGYKTKSGAILYLIFEIIKKSFPELLNESTEEVVKYSIDLIILTGGLDWLWRNKDEVISFIKNIFTKKD